MPSRPVIRAGARGRAGGSTADRIAVYGAAKSAGSILIEEPSMRDRPCLTSADVEKALRACTAEAQTNKWNVSIAVLDEGGFLLGFHRMDGAPPISAEVSIGKARTAAMTKRPSKFFEDRVKERPAFVNFPAGILIQGGLPIMNKGECVGAIGVSGVQSHEDEQVAQAGVSAIG
jgi:glc operon protein GlcG